MLATTPIEAGTRISSGTPSIHALRDIEEGHEITIYYLNTLLSRETRQEALRTTFMFTCSCRLCSLPRHQSQESDRRLDEILRLEASIVEKGLVGYISAPERTLRYADRIVCLYNEHRPDDGGLPRAFLSAAHIAIVHGDLVRAQIFVERARLGWTALEGDDSHLQVTLLSQDPSKSKSYGLSMKWKTSVDEIPKELAPEEFEDWLWRRQKPRQPGQPVNFRDQAVFPSFMNLPNETDADPIFFESRDGLAYRPRQHWCFLAEIVSFDTLARLRMDVKDVDGKTVRLIFYTEGRGSEMAPSQIRNGYTIAILYAQRHAFSILETGIRHGEPVKLKVPLPLPLRQQTWETFLTKRVHAGISNIAQQVVGSERPGPNILNRNEWKQSMSRLRYAGALAESLCEVFSFLVLQYSLSDCWLAREGSQSRLQASQRR